MNSKTFLALTVMSFLFLLLGITRALALDDSPNTNVKALHGMELVHELQKGGYVIYLRHGKTNMQEQDLDIENLENCSTQRNLSEEGEKQAALIGKAIKELNIQIADVISSPYCRCLDTAKLAFGKAKPSKDLYFAIGVTEEERKRLTENLKKMLATKPPVGKNTVLVSHTANLKEAADIWPKPEAVAVIFRPHEDTFRYTGSILPNEWENFLKHQ